MSEQEAFLRLNVPDGLETNGTWPKNYITGDISAPGEILKASSPWRNHLRLSDGVCI